jgi:hypothetical protein
MRYHEIITEAKTASVTLPPKAEAALGKVKKITLKDQKIVKLVLQRAELGVHIDATIDGMQFAAGSLSLSLNNVPAAPDDPEDWDQYAEDRGSWSASSLHVDTTLRRRGLATAMYDYATRLGFKILPSGRGYGGKLLPDGDALWQSRRKSPRLGQRMPKQDRFWKPKK